MTIKQRPNEILHTTPFLTSILLLLASSAIAQSGYNYYQNGAGGVVQAANNGQAGVSVQQWFQSYDAVRRQAQMTPQERAKADAMLSKGLSIIVPGPEKASTQQLLTKLVGQYRTACQQLERLPLLPPTEQLHRGYYQYFSEAQGLFSDYLKVQDDLFAVDQNGKPLAGKLVERKASLEALDERNKDMDAQLRQQFSIPAYRY
jgi:hypothetical protein